MRSHWLWADRTCSQLSQNWRELMKFSQEFYAWHGNSPPILIAIFWNNERIQCHYCRFFWLVECDLIPVSHCKRERHFKYGDNRHLSIGIISKFILLRWYKTSIIIILFDCCLIDMEFDLFRLKLVKLMRELMVIVVNSSCLLCTL